MLIPIADLLGDRQDLVRLLDKFDETVQSLSSRYIFFLIKPQSKQSTQFGFGHAFTPKKKRLYVKALADRAQAIYLQIPPTRNLVRFTLLYCFAWTKKELKKPDLPKWALYGYQPDLDNLIKPTQDALRGIVYLDDRQVVEFKVRKIRWVEHGILLKIEEVCENYGVELA